LFVDILFMCTGAFINEINSSHTLTLARPICCFVFCILVHDQCFPHVILLLISFLSAFFVCFCLVTISVDIVVNNENTNIIPLCRT